jgi:hypothetical protein
MMAAEGETCQALSSLNRTATALAGWSLKHRKLWLMSESK